MKLLQRTLAVFSVVLLLVGLVYISPYQYLIKGVRLTYLKGEKSANYLDWKYFDLHGIANDSQHITPILMAENRFDVPLSEPLMKVLEQTHSGSFLVFRNDSLICERYMGALLEEAGGAEGKEGQEMAAKMRSNSFSMAKTITYLIAQKAIQNGLIPSWDVPVRKYLPWVGMLDESGNPAAQTNPQWELYAEKLTLRHLITMTAGLEWDESYVSPFGITAKAYYGTDVESTMKRIPIVREPGTHYQYQSGATQLMGLVLIKATGKPLAELASEFLWKPLGMEMPASWQLDRENGKELSYCCVDAVARDFGRLGLMVLHNGKGVIDSAALVEAQKPFKADHYGHAFWIGEEAGIKFTYFNGLNGQYICMIPAYNMVIIRTGHGVLKGDKGPVFECIRTYVKEAVAQFGKK